MVLAPKTSARYLALCLEAHFVDGSIAVGSVGSHHAEGGCFVQEGSPLLWPNKTLLHIRNGELDYLNRSLESVQGRPPSPSPKDT